MLQVSHEQNQVMALIIHSAYHFDIMNSFLDFLSPENKEGYILLFIHHLPHMVSFIWSVSITFSPFPFEGKEWVPYKQVNFILHSENKNIHGHGSACFCPLCGYFFPDMCLMFLYLRLF